MTTDYLKRSEALDFRMNNMKETLFNQIKQSEFDLIVSLGKGELKSQDTFYYLKQMTLNQVKLYNFTHTYNGIKEMVITSIHNLKLEIILLSIIKKRSISSRYR